VEWFKDQYQKSNIISGWLAVTIWGAIVYLSVVQVPVPDILYAGGMAVIAFFFGTKVGEQSGVNRALRELSNRDKEV